MTTFPALADLTSDRAYRQLPALTDYPAWAICRPAGNTGCVLDAGYLDSVSTPDFVTHGCGPTFLASAEQCKAAIVRNAEGLDTNSRGQKRGPYNCLVGYELHYRLMPHWDRKLLMAEMGVDPNTVMASIRRDDVWSLWPIKGEWLDRSKAVRHLEFFFQLCLAVEAKRIQSQPDLVAASSMAIADALMDEMTTSYLRVSRLDTSHADVRVRAHKALAALVDAQTPAFA